MSFGTGIPPIRALACAFSLVCWVADTGANEPAPPALIRHHALSVVLHPEAHGLTAEDRMLLTVAAPQARLRFTLAQSLSLQHVQMVTGTGGDERRSAVPFVIEDSLSGSNLHTVSLNLPSDQAGDIRLVWRYAGSINDPPREPRHLRFVTPSETSGHIGSEGVYLSSESGWYPDLDGSLASFALSVEVSEGWTTVSQGVGRTKQECDHKTSGSACAMRQEWETGPSEALTLVANRFVAKMRQWKGANGQVVQLATYFLAENAGLADEYLDATAKYLDMYSALLGAYPFEKFAVVENFFASGLGMPSFTLLGSGSIKRHYVQPYALGHEIVHSWIGNSVLNRVDSGNWVEGLTTYLANYYWHEAAGDQRQAREQRRLMTQGYSLHVEPDQDYPVGRFNRKSDERDNAIGYQKSAMIFHLLRQEIGEEPFWRGVKQLVKDYRGRFAEWADLEHIFSGQYGKDLRWFFAQWVERGGAPVLSIADATAASIDESGRAGSFRLRVRLQQNSPVFRLSAPLDVTMKTETKTVLVPLGTGRDEIDVILPSQPLTVALDPAFTVLRRFSRDQMAPVLNLYATDRRKAVLPAFGERAAPFHDLIARIAAQDGGLSPERRTTVLSADAALPPSGSVLILATPEHHRHVQGLVGPSCGGRATLKEAGFDIGGKGYEGPALAALFSCHRADVPGSVLTVLYAVTPEAAAKVARLLFFYGWHSYIVFQEGAVAARELWQIPHAIKEVRLDEHR